MEAILAFGRGRWKLSPFSSGEYGGGEGGGRRSWPPLSHLQGVGVMGEGGRESRSVLVLDAACMHVVLHYVSLSRISILL